MSGPYWWALALAGLTCIAAWSVRRLVARAPSGRTDDDDPLVGWVVALRESGDAVVVPPSVHRAAGRGCAVGQRAGVRIPSATTGPSATTRPPEWRGSRRPPVAGSGSPARSAETVTVTGAVPSGRRAAPRLATGRTPGAPSGSDVRRTDPATGGTEFGLRPVPSRRSRWSGWPRRNLVLGVLVAAGIAGLLAGPVAALACAGYGGLGVRALSRHDAAALRTRTRRERLDQLCALAADLRAGLPVPVAAQALGLVRPVPSAPPDLTDPTGSAKRSSGTVGTAQAALPATTEFGESAPSGDLPVPAHPAVLPDRPGQLAQAAVRLADRTGAPLADLIERIEADARSIDRGRAAAAAQAAGARATAWLLAALPLGGIGLGYGIGVDPLQVLLHTPIGAGCAAAAIALQVVGLLWADRLGTVPDGGS
ncbi:hypothetical protein [Micromonospora zingiberis]|uniref:hypothetical protein n=1 Tax=Micromonospora zingiberis TaxID=2053011 RepID=UPI0026907A14